MEITRSDYGRSWTPRPKINIPTCPRFLPVSQARSQHPRGSRSHCRAGKRSRAHGPGRRRGNSSLRKETREELEKYAGTVSLPAWFTQIVPVTGGRSQEAASDEKYDNMPSLPGTDPRLYPGDFEIGSPASRAPARNLLHDTGPQNLFEAQLLCWKCFLSGLPVEEPTRPAPPL